MSDINAESGNGNSPEVPKSENNVSQMTAQALLILDKGFYFPDNLYPLIDPPFSRLDPEASEAVIAARLDAAENLPIATELPTKNELKAELRRAILSGGHLTPKEGERFFQTIITDEKAAMEVLKDSLARAKTAEAALEARGSRTSGNLFEYHSRILSPLIQLLHPKLHNVEEEQNT